MSLIEQALRRVQDPLIPKQDPPPEAAQHKASKRGTPQGSAHSWSAAQSETAPLLSTTNLLLSITVAVLTLTGLILLGGAFWMGRSTSIGTTAVNTQSAAVPTASKPAPTKPIIRTGKPGTLEAATIVQAPTPRKRSTASRIANIPLIAIPWAKRPAKKEEIPLVLTGVVEGMGDPYAVINGMIVAEGDRVADMILVEIANGAVRFRRMDGTETTVRMVR